MLRVASERKDVDGRHETGHDELKVGHDESHAALRTLYQRECRPLSYCGPWSCLRSTAASGQSDSCSLPRRSGSESGGGPVHSGYRNTDPSTVGREASSAFQSSPVLLRGTRTTFLSHRVCRGEPFSIRPSGGKTPTSTPPALGGWAAKQTKACPEPDPDSVRGANRVRASLADTHSSWASPTRLGWRQRDG
jgi:hypothetical protein